MKLTENLPLDYNKSSKIVLITIFNEKGHINVYSMRESFKSFGEIKKIVIFIKNNTQVFIEFLTTTSAKTFKNTYHASNYRNDSLGLKFYMKIQFTKKSHLQVRKNSDYEHDFSIPTIKTNFSGQLNHHVFKKSTFNKRPMNQVASMQNFDEVDEPLEEMKA